MQITILKEAGYEEALRGMSYSYHDRADDVDEWWKRQYPQAVRRAALLAGKGAGHDKFLRQIMLWVDIEASRAWWSEFDTYKVGTVANSESTMHRLAKREPNQSDFEDGTSYAVVDAFVGVWHAANGDINALKMNLPEGYLQRRMVTLNYANLRNIIEQRTGHRLKWWDVFIDAIKSQAQHPELLTGLPATAAMSEVTAAVLAEREACIAAIDASNNCECGVPCDCFTAGSAKMAIKMRSNAEAIAEAIRIR